MPPSTGWWCIISLCNCIPDTFGAARNVMTGGVRASPPDRDRISPFLCTNILRLVVDAAY